MPDEENIQSNAPNIEHDSPPPPPPPPPPDDFQMSAMIKGSVNIPLDNIIISDINIREDE